MFDKIITITLNPSLDTTIWIDRLDLKEPVFATKEKVYPGGKAINVSRVLTALGVENKAIGFVGSDNKSRFTKLLQLDNVNHDFISISGIIRENLSVVSPSGEMLKINRAGFSVSKKQLNKLKDKIKNMIEPKETVLLVFAGSLPNNITPSDYKELILSVKTSNVKIALDNDIFTLEQLKQIKPFIIKPNEHELNNIAKRQLKKITQVKEFAKLLSKDISHVLVSIGEKGIVYCGDENIITCIPPKVKVVSTVGAGDTTLAGFIKALLDKKTIKQAVKYATACGTSAVLLEGTDIITPSEVENILKTITYDF